MANLKGRKSSLGKRRRDHRKHGVRDCGFASDLLPTLPEALVDELLAKLPISSLVRFCRVCKRWRDLIHSSEITRCTSGYPHLFLFSKKKLTIFNSRRGIWEILPLQFLQKQFEILDVVSSAGGLLCFSTATIGEYIVCNPLTKCFKRLQMPCSSAGPISDQPCMPIPYFVTIGLKMEARHTFLVGMVLDSDTGHFKLIVTSLFPGSGGWTLAYDSHANLWEEVANIPEDFGQSCLLNRDSRWITCTCGGNIYVYFTHRASIQDTLFKYDVEQQEWSSILLPGSKGVLNNVIECNGKVLILTLKYEFKFLQETGPTLWLRTNSRPLSRYCALPNMGDSKCLGKGDVLFLIRTKEPCKLPSPSLRYSVKISVLELFHNVATDSISEVISKWEEYRVHKNILPNFRIFTPSLLGFK